MISRRFSAIVPPDDNLVYDAHHTVGGIAAKCLPNMADGILIVITLIVGDVELCVQIQTPKALTKSSLIQVAVEVTKETFPQRVVAPKGIGIRSCVGVQVF